MNKKTFRIFFFMSILMLTITTFTTHNTTTIDNIFGTDGIRATVGNAPFTQQALHHMGWAIGQWAVEQYGDHPTILVGHDTRLSCAWVKSCLKSGLLMHNITLIDAGVLPTPAVVQLTLHNQNIDCGIIISASHNPYQDNGLKIIDGNRGKLTLEDEQKITALFYREIPKIEYDRLGQDMQMYNAADLYMNYIQKFLQPDFLKGKKIVLDCAHGATYQIAPALFEQYGAEIVCIGNNPNGININDHCGATDLYALQKRVSAEHADIGFAFDGDGDRVMAVNSDGEIKDGDAILAMLIDHPAYKQSSAMVGTIMTNKGFENWLTEKNYTLIRTSVGDKYIAREMEKAEGRLIIGGEQSGHIILYDYLPTGDGIFTALRLMETIITTNNNLMHTFAPMPQYLINVAIKQKKDLTHDPFASIIKKWELSIPHGRILVRFSGTEAKLRVMVEDNDAELAYHIGHTLAQELQEALER